MRHLNAGGTARKLATNRTGRAVGGGRDRRALMLALMLAGAAASLIAATGRVEIDTGGVTIPYGDLNLSTIEGAQLLEDRLVEAANAVCKDLDTPGVPAEAFNRCRMDAVAGAILMLRRPPSAVGMVTS
jgi:UrcA family protein